ncbi:TPA: phage anti-RecBCD protein [Salmonella enterica subsp. diarizonae serovar 61:r:-]
MPAPLYGADDPRRCSGSSMTEVLENIKNNLDAFLALPPETKAERKYRRDIQLAEKQEKDRINETAIRPFRKATYTKFIEIDPRLRDYRSRYGAISNN